MAQVITELANFSKAAFFDNVTWLNQENWQSFFGGSLPTGVIVDGGLGASGQNYTDSLIYEFGGWGASYGHFAHGKIIANGIYAEYTGSDNIRGLSQSDGTRLFVARVYLLTGDVKIVGKAKIASDYGYSGAVFADMLLHDESLGCVRDDTYFEIPLAFEIYGGAVYDLRRLFYVSGSLQPNLAVGITSGATSNGIRPDILFSTDFVRVYGGMNYDIDYDGTADHLFVYPVPALSPKPTTVSIKNSSDSALEVRLPMSNYLDLALSYDWIENWDTEENSRYKYKELVSGDKMTLILTPFKATPTFGYTVASKAAASGGSIDPDDYFTKQETADLLAYKADLTYVDNELALKADTADLGTLAEQDSADYITQVTNKPTLGLLASKDHANLSTDVTGILPIANGGTGASNLGGIVEAIIDTASASIYVNYLTGDDSTGDGTSDHPYKTIQKGIDSASPVVPVTIMILPGEYAERIVINGKNITLKGISNTEIKIGASGLLSSQCSIEVINGGQLHLKGIFTLQKGNYSTVKISDGGRFYYENISSSDTLSIIRSGASRTLIVEKGGFFEAIAETDIVITSSTTSGYTAINVDSGGIVMLPTIKVTAHDAFYMKGGLVMYYSLSASSSYTNVIHPSSWYGAVIAGLKNLTTS